jgi:ATP-dependent Clp protease protease subunit
MEINLREMLKLKTELYDIIAHHSGQTYEWVEKSSDRDYWMTSEEAKNFGMVDEVLQRKEEK